MSDNKTFFKNARKGKLSFGEIFSGVTKKHTSTDTDKLFISGTELTTPRESEMLGGWQKPYLFARFFLGAAAIAFTLWFLSYVTENEKPLYTASILIPFIMPMTLLLLTWELNIPRNISLLDILKMVMIGGLISIGSATILFTIDDSPAIWAGLVEEPAKLFAIIYFLRKKNYKYAINGLLVGMAVGTGFAIFESLAYTMEWGLIGAADGVLEAQKLGADINGIAYLALLRGGQGALETALVRALSAVGGHGIWASLYGYALTKAKGAKKLEMSHFGNAQFLLYFLASIGLHALHNSGIRIGLPVLFNIIEMEYLLIAVLAVVVFMTTLRPAVNQAVYMATQHNEGSVTMAVEREAAPVAAPVMDAGSASLVRCQWNAGPLSGQLFQIPAGRAVTLGRVAGRCDIPLVNCENVSSRHCRIELSGGIVMVTDLGSTNGTFVDGRRLVAQQPTPVAAGSSVYLGNQSCGFTVQG
ncbi:MAG: PrsW family intramembrane metalloprotease [Ruminococcaceae bacterium]|nr:PrsW family intramembrane metalloprotease [Oscillospiraceae bacterium]